eukprot:TRINITY_DN4553_c0_g2_i1.p1 TRINITY_DN4553_c0_g2~~TRINITY_DN4553_c0_g2_i1.p1  ORF type:complete len:271 (+),score=64.79 TRINITY_DN4553_c0_g2_i1:116-928(+)
MKEPFENGFLDDFEIRKELWKTCIPIHFKLHPNELSALNSPPPLYKTVNRNTFLPLLASSIRKHFSSFITTLHLGTHESELWFEYNGTPLKWNYPVGVLYDIFSTSSSPLWEVVVRFQGFPSDQLIPYQNENSVKNYFLNSLKESVYIKNGDCSKINSLSVSDSADLWEGFKQLDYNRFWGSNRKLHPESNLKFIPIRLFKRNQSSYTQEIIFPLRDNNKPKQLEDIFSEIGSENPSSVIISGVQPPLDSPLLWVSENLCHPDHFLYIIC